MDFIETEFLNNNSVVFGGALHIENDKSIMQFD